MSPLRIELAGAPIEAVAAELAVVAFFELEAPVAGSAGRVDWRLCGALSRLALEGELRGAHGEATLVPSGGGIAALWVLVLGLGPRAGFDRQALERFVAEAFDRSRRLRVRSVALGWPTRLALTASDQVDALLQGLDGPPAPQPDALSVVATPSEAAALAEALRARAALLPEGLALAAPLLAPMGPRASSLARSRPIPPQIARLRVK